MPYIIDTKEMIDSISITDFLQWQINKQKRVMEFGANHLRRTTATFSNDATIEELRSSFETMFFMPVGALRNWKPKEGNHSAEGRFRKVLLIIEDQCNIFKSGPKTSLDKIEELEQIGEFIVAYNEQMQLEVQTVPLKYPDFIVIYGGRRIGIEHTRLIDGQVNSIFNRMKYCVDGALKKLSIELPGTTGNVNVYFSQDLPVVNGKSFRENFEMDEREIVAEQIAQYIKSLLINMPIEKPSYIVSVLTGSNTSIPLGITVGQDYIPEKPGQANAIINKRITEKEKKYNAYASAKGLDAVWLLIVMQGVKESSGYKLDKGEVPESVESDFEKIFVYESFDYEIKEIATTKKQVV